MDGPSRRVPKQERARAKRQALLDAGLREFSAREYPEVTARSIAKAAGVSVGTFYEYFDSKDVLLRTVQERLLRTFMERVVDDDAPDPAEAIRRGLALTYAFHVEHPRLHATVEYRRRFDPELEALMQTLDAAIAQRIRSALQRWKVPGDEAVAFTIVAMAEGLVHRIVFGDPPGDPEGLLEHGGQLILGALGTGGDQ
ncbi:MAG: TetR/AcrR family transcriptional regulator [Nannocystaceae bacterium]|nr:TetR/AcrR family transcriptional regulator [bacterium]